MIDVMVKVIRAICNGPDDLRLFHALATNQPVSFWAFYGQWETDAPDKMDCRVMGVERGDGQHEYHLAVQIIGLKTPQWQYFKYCTLTYQGEWVGCLDIGHRAYEGHSFRVD